MFILKEYQPLLRISFHLGRETLRTSVAGKAGGFLAYDWSDGSPLGPLQRRSFQLHEKLAESFGAESLGYRRVGALSMKTTVTNTGASNLPPWLGNLLSHNCISGAPQNFFVHEWRIVSRNLHSIKRIKLWCLWQFGNSLDSWSRLQHIGTFSSSQVLGDEILYCHYSCSLLQLILPLKSLSLIPATTRSWYRQVLSCVYSQTGSSAANLCEPPWRWCYQGCNLYLDFTILPAAAKSRAYALDCYFSAYLHFDFLQPVWRSLTGSKAPNQLCRQEQEHCSAQEGGSWVVG